MSLLVRYPEGYGPERAYILSVVLGEFLGLSFRCEVGGARDVVITLGGDPRARRLTVADVFFQTPAERWLTALSLPRQPLRRWLLPPTLAGARTLDPELPVLFGAADDLYREEGEEAFLGLDVFGSAFFCLSRYEELARPERDLHDRFPAAASLAFREGFLERPVINEYVEVLWAALQRLWPSLGRGARSFRFLPSHDVDRPFASYHQTPDALRAILVAMRRGDRALAGRHAASAWRTLGGDHRRDMYYTFDTLLAMHARHGHRAAFYFNADPRRDLGGPGYRLADPAIQALLRQLSATGHEIGLHPGYRSHLDGPQLQTELRALRQSLEALGLQQQAWGGRQHYLRWRNPETWQLWAEAGLAYDSSLGFAEAPGFRAGVCYEFPTFDLRRRRALGLRERPLVAMEASLLDDKRLAPEEAFRRLELLLGRCRHFDGDFTLLWHNHRLCHERERRLFEAMLAAVNGEAMDGLRWAG